jgi:phosphoserine phosphatase
MDKNIVIFDLDGTLALIDKRRDISMKDNGKMDWAKFFNPDNIDLDLPNQPVIDMANMLHSQGLLYKPDNDLKQGWLDTIKKHRVAMVFDDRQQVVDMWRQNGLTVFQVADGDF